MRRKIYVAAQEIGGGAVLALVCLVATALLAPTGAFAAWTNGQAADLVLGKADFTTEGGVASQTNLAGPTGVCYDSSSGSIFVTDFGAHRVLRWNSANAYTSGSAATSVLGQANFTDAEANRDDATAANSMNQPLGCAVSSTGTLFVADSGNNRILRFDSAASKADGADADGVLGQANFTSGDENRGGAAAANTLDFPWNPALESSGRLWIADGSNSRVLRYDSAASKVNGAVADGVLGQADFTSTTPNRGIALAANSLSYPLGVAAGPNGVIWVADSDNTRALRFDNAAAKADGADADGVLGQADFLSSVSSVTAATVSGPMFAVSADGSGGLYIIDAGAQRILYHVNAVAKANGADADTVLGQPDFTSSGANLTATSLGWDPMSISFDPGHGRIWVADYSNTRVISYYNPALDPRPTPSPTPSVPTMGLGALAAFALLLVGVSLYRARRLAV